MMPSLYLCTLGYTLFTNVYVVFYGQVWSSFLLQKWLTVTVTGYRHPQNLQIT